MRSDVHCHLQSHHWRSKISKFNVPHEEFICSIGFEPEEIKYKVVLTIKICMSFHFRHRLSIGLSIVWLRLMLN